MSFTNTESLTSPVGVSTLRITTWPGQKLIAGMSQQFILLSIARREHLHAIVGFGLPLNFMCLGNFGRRIWKANKKRKYIYIIIYLLTVYLEYRFQFFDVVWIQRGCWISHSKFLIWGPKPRIIGRTISSCFAQNHQKDLNHDDFKQHSQNYTNHP